MRKLINNFKLKLLLLVSLFVASIILFSASGLILAKADTEEPFVPVMTFEENTSVKITSEGLRFRVEIDKATRDYIVDNENVTMGFFIAPTELMTAVEDKNYHGMSKKIEVSVNEDTIYANDAGNYYVNGCVYNFLPKNRTKDYTAVAFIKVDGEYTYSNLSVSKGIYSSLNELVMDKGVSKAKINNIMDIYTWFGLEEYPVVIANETDYERMCALANDGITFENMYVKVLIKLFVADLPSTFKGVFTADSEPVYNYGFRAEEVGVQQLGTITLPTANKIDSANQVVEENVLATKVTLNGNEVAITNNTIEATQEGVYQVVFSGDADTIETIVDLRVRGPHLADEIEAFSDENFVANFFLRTDSEGGSAQKGATLSWLEQYQGAKGVAKIDFSYNASAGGNLCGFNLIPRFTSQAELIEYDYIIVRAFVPLANDNLTRIGLGYYWDTDPSHMPVCKEWLNWADPSCKGIWFEFKLDMTVDCWTDRADGVYREYLTGDKLMSLEFFLTGNITIYIDSISAGKNSTGLINAVDANDDGVYSANEEVTLSVDGLDNVEFTVLDPYGTSVAVVDGKFVPAIGGEYTITSNYLSIATKIISVTAGRVPFGENEIEAFSDANFAQNFYLRQDTQGGSTQKGATLSWLDEYQGAEGVVKIDITYDADAGSAKSCGFNMVPRFTTQADLVNYDYIIVRAFIPLYNDNFGRLALGYYWSTEPGHMPIATEYLNWADTECKGKWYDFKIDLSTKCWPGQDEEYRDYLTGSYIMSFEVPIFGDVTLYIDSITAGKNA